MVPSMAKLRSPTGLFALCAVLALLGACGGGGDGAAAPTSLAVPPPTTSPASPTGPATPAPAGAAVEIVAFSPVSGAPGSMINVSGVGLATVTAARVGGVEAGFRVVSDGALEVTVPAAARSGRIELSASGRVVLSASDYTVMAIPAVTSVAPTTLLPPGRLTLGGRDLDRVSEVRLNAQTLVLGARSATSLVVDVPAGAASGTLTIVDAAGVARPLAQPITIVGPVAITSFSPASIVTGQMLTVNGSFLDRATALVFANGVTAAIASRTGTTRLTAVVPDSAASGVFRVRGDAGDEALSASPLQVITAIRVDANAVYRVAAAGERITIPGSGLNEVSAIRVGSTSVPIVERSATQLAFNAPSLACGAITLESTSQPAVGGGSMVVGGGCVANVAGVEFAQVQSQAASDPRLRLVPGKETWVRAYVVSAQSNVPAPLVRLTAYNGAAIVGTLDMAGPAMLPQVPGATVPDAVRYDEGASFNVELPAAWVRAGLSVRVEADPLRQYGAPVTMDATPLLGAGTRMEVVLVPVISGGFTPTMPATDAVRDEIVRRFPVPRANISVTVRAAYTLASVTDGLDTSSEWSSALSELNQLRQMESGSNATRFYFGFVRRSGGGIAGIGYVPGRTSLGWDATTQWARTMSHELGHNLSRPHAPCGGVASPDPNYPYAGGLLGPTPLLDSVPAAIDIVSPVTQADIMGYCNGVWFSDYNYREMQRYMEGQPSLVATQALVQNAQDADGQDLLLVSGTIGLDGMQLAPVQAMRGTAPSNRGAYTLRLHTRDGRTIEHGFDAEQVDHAMPPELHFSVAVPDPGVALARVEVLRGQGVVPFRFAGQATVQRTAGADIERLRGVDWSETGGALHVGWDSAGAASIAVTHVAGNVRTVLGIGRRGGSATFDTRLLPPGGHFEVALSDGLNARVLRLPR